MAEGIHSFRGFSPRATDFLKGLEDHNEKAWFEAHRDDYRNHLLAPLQDLVMELAPAITAIDPDLETIPAVNKTISRIHRDTRFARNKSPYKTTMWITFKRALQNWQDAPAYFFEIAPDSYRYGMGFYSATKETMDRFRQMIDRKPDEFRQAVSSLVGQDRFVPEGELYKRLLKDDLAADLRDWYQRKNLYVVCNRKTDDHLFSRNLATDMIEGFRLLAPFYHYLWKTKR